jgi:hypothetical protein
MITAQVTSISSVRVLATTRIDLEKIIRKHSDIGCKVYYNLSSILVDRLVDTNLLARNVLSQISLF